jgi:uncharacterized protein (TIGR02246 family)
MTLSAQDRLDILELLARADDAATTRDAGGYAQLFTEDSVMDGAKGEFYGRDAIGAAVGAVWASEGEGTAHLTLNAVIGDEGTDGKVVARSTLMIVSLGTPPELVSLSAITHHLVKVGARWRVARRTVGKA